MKNLDLSHDPPPDLVIEIDVTSPSLNKMPIYAALGVPEVWLFKGEKVVFYKLYGGLYQEVNDSAALPFLDSQTANMFLEKGSVAGSIKWIREIREWTNKK